MRMLFPVGSKPSHVGPDRIGDLLNEQSGFFPFQLESGDTTLYNRAHIVQVRSPPDVREQQIEPGYEVATRHLVSMPHHGTPNHRDGLGIDRKVMTV